MKKYFNGLIFFLSSVIFSFHANALDEDATKIKTITATCVACHNVDGNSTNPIWPKLAGQHAKYLIKQLNDYKKGPTGPRFVPIMYGMVTTLSAEDIELLSNYYATQTTSVGYAKTDLIKLGQKIYLGGNLTTGVAACSGCHGPDGAGNKQAGFPKLAGQHADYIVSQLIAYRDGKRSNDQNAIMRTISKKLTPEEMNAVASFIEGLY